MIYYCKNDRTISQYRGGIQIEASLPLPHAGTPGLQGRPEPCPDPAAPGLRCRSDSRAGVQSPDLSFVSARHEWHLVADTALFAGELPDQQQRASNFLPPRPFQAGSCSSSFWRRAGTCTAFHPPARVCAGPPGRTLRPVSLFVRSLGDIRHVLLPQELAHPALLRPAHTLYRCIRDLQLYLSAGRAGVHPWACPGKAALSGAFSSHSGCGVPVHPVLGSGAPPLYAGTQKPVGSRSGERSPCQNTAAPAGRCAAAVEPQCAGPVCSGLFRSFPAGLQCGGADRTAEHPRHAAARPCAVSVGDPLLRLFAGLQGHHGPVHHHRIPLRSLP